MVDQDGDRLSIAWISCQSLVDPVRPTADTSTPLRRQVRLAVVRGGGLLSEAAAGFRDGLELLQRGPMPNDALERDLEEAREHGRWLSDEERQQRSLERARQEQQCRVERQRRHGLLILLVVCVLLPPFWPLALGITAYLLFPRTTRRLTVLALVLLVVGSVLTITLLVLALMAWL